MKILSILLVLSASLIAQFPPPGNWFGYNELSPQFIQAHGGMTSPPLNAFEVNIDWSLFPQTFVAQFEAWAFVDFNIGSNPFVSSEPLMYTGGSNTFDADIATSILLPSLGLNVFDVATGSSATVSSSQAGGVAYNVVWNSVNALRFTRLSKVDLGPVNPSAQLFPVEIHVIGNMNNSEEGSGWFYLTSGTVVLL